MSAMVAPADSAALFRRVIDPDRGTMSPELAHFVLELDFPPDDHVRYQQLCARVQEQKLTSDEETELKNYLHVDNLLAILRLKAKRSLAKAAPTR
jgi:hypothetical protein